MTGSTQPVVRRRLDLRGLVQAVGFRPFVYRLASEHGLAGCVANNSNGAVIEIEGPLSVVDAFEEDLVRRLPPLVELITRAGGRRIVQRPYGEELPRIC